jgi:GNAT superfamily N-acetyltransferase
MELQDLRYTPSLLPFAQNLYESAFPKEERMPFWMLRWRSRQNNIRFYVVMQEAEPVGLVHLITGSSGAYLMYFAVAEMERGKGLGRRIVSLLKEQFAGQNLFLCVEPLTPTAPNLAQRKRRKSFYHRCGFEETGYQAREGTVIFDVLSWGTPFRPEEYLRLLRRFIGFPLRLVFHPAVFPANIAGGSQKIGQQNEPTERKNIG